MDEGLLNDLLECSVCLERLDTSSRVLPCQHTFCLKCLKVIVESHKELRCPECRVLVEAKVEELPPNVLLMRILEGMKNAPRKSAGSGHRVKVGNQLAQLQQSVQQRDGKQLPPHARAMYDYISKEQGDLSFKKGETILLHKKLDPFWFQGECSGRTGMFPITYVQVVVPLQATTALCKALYDFRMSAPDEEGCLAFDKGAIITVHRRVDENWAEGRLEQRVGIFPIAFVELNQPARQLMNSAPLNRAVPPLPDQVRAGHSDLRHHNQPQRYQQMSMSTPASNPHNYQNMPPMSKSQPGYLQAARHQQAQVLVNQPVLHLHVPVSGSLVGGPTRADSKHTHHSIDLIHLHAAGAVTMQAQGRINTDSGDRLRSAKLESYNSTPVHAVESTYKNQRTHEHFPAAHAFGSNNASSDSSSSMNTPSSCGVSSTPTTSADSSSPSLPSSPDSEPPAPAPAHAPAPAPAHAQPNDAEHAHTNNDQHESSLNTSMGVLSLNESSTATNTSLNVSLPPSESPKLNASNASTSSHTQVEVQQGAINNEPIDAPSSSKVHRSSGPDSLLNFGLGLQAALSPSHGKDGNYMVSRNHREHHHNREKRHSLTPSSHLQSGHSTQNRHSAEILATSLLDHVPERDRDKPIAERERERRRRRSRSSERPLPAAYVALYPYKPQKVDELELKKGAVYTVTERCRDGWFKGCGAGSGRCGVFPGNYVAPKPAPASSLQVASVKHKRSASPNCSFTSPAAVTSQSRSPPAPPDAPPRAPSPPPAAAQPPAPRADKSKEKSKAEKCSISSGVSLMKRLAAMKKCKSPPPAGYSMDNPVFEDGPGPSCVLLNLPQQHHPVHVRSGSCPSQLLRTLPGSERVRHKERPTVLCVREYPSTANDSPWQSQHRKSQSLDVTATRRDRHHSQNVKERFRCIVPYPPNSEYELELKVDDIVVVSRKRGDGWYKGTLQRTGRSGLFPASFVQSAD